MEKIKYYNHARRDQKKIALTFDDGPNPPRTDQIIEILDHWNIRGTFFVLGKWVEHFPDATRRIAQSNHIIGNHGFEHLKGVCDFAKAEAIISNISGRPTTYMRAPYFECMSYNHLHPFILKDTIRIHCDVYSADCEAIHAQTIISTVLKNAHLQGGSIIDFHDGSENPDDMFRLTRPIPLLEALPIIIREILNNNYQIVGLDELEFVDSEEWIPAENNT